MHPSLRPSLFLFLSRTLSLALSLALLSPALYGLTLDDKKVPIEIGNRGMTRMTVKGDKIEHIFCSPVQGEENVTHHTSGHVFVSPQGLPSGFYLTLITHSGVTQDLLIRVGKKECCPVVLEKPVFLPPFNKEEAKKILEIFSAGGVPPEFKEVLISEPPRDHQDTIFYPKKSFSDGRWYVHMFESNKIKKVNIPPEALVRCGDIAISSLCASHGGASGKRTPRFYVISTKELHNATRKT